VIRLQNLVTTNLFYIAEKNGVKVCCRTLLFGLDYSFNVAMGWTYGVRYLVNEGGVCLLPCHTYF
jgi:hypothetical protein